MIRENKIIVQQGFQFDILSIVKSDRYIWVELVTVPPNCRDPKDLLVLATAIDGAAAVIVSGDDDLRADDALRAAMETCDIQLLGV